MQRVKNTILNGLRYRVAAPSIRIVPWAALASCWPPPHQLLPVSAAGAFIAAQTRIFQIFFFTVGNPLSHLALLDASSPEGGAFSPSAGKQSKTSPLRGRWHGASRDGEGLFPVQTQSSRFRQRLPPRGSWQSRQALTEGVSLHKNRAARRLPGFCYTIDLP